LDVHCSTQCLQPKAGQPKCCLRQYCHLVFTSWIACQLSGCFPQSFLHCSHVLRDKSASENILHARQIEFNLLCMQAQLYAIAEPQNTAVSSQGRKAYLACQIKKKLEVCWF